MQNFRMKRKTLDINPWNFLFLTVSGIINAIGVVLFLVPLQLLDGGLSGTAYLLDQITPSYLTLSIFLLTLNFPFFIMGYKKLGIPFVIYSLYAIAIYSLSSYLLQHVIPLDYSNGSPISGDDILIAALFGGLLSGVGSGLAIRFGGALDGVEVMAVLFAKKIGLTVGTFVMSYNVILYLVSAIVFKSWLTPLYSVVAYVVGIKTVDFIVEGLDKAKAAFIITDKSNEMMKVLSEHLKRGITTINAKGYYSDKDKKIVYCVVNRFEIVTLKKLIKQVDEFAFVTINDVSDIIGSKPTLQLKKRNRGEEAIERLRNGVTMPNIGFGTWLLESPKERTLMALKAGYRHIDTADAYENEKEIGEAIIESKINRKDIFITSKIRAEVKTYQEAKESIERSLANLKTSYIDLMLIHAPRPWNEMNEDAKNHYYEENIEVYRAMEEYYSEGKIRAIGVSNFEIDDLENLIKNVKVKPAVNQIYFAIGIDQSALITYCRKHHIVVEAYSPFRHGKALQNDIIEEIARRYNKTSAQICVRYCLQKKTIPLPKASSLERMKENLDINFQISKKDMEILDRIKG